MKEQQPFCYYRAEEMYPTLYLLRSYDYNMHVEGLLLANMCLVTLFSSEQCSQFEIFRLQNVHIVNKTSSFKTNLIDNNAETSRGNRNTL